MLKKNKGIREALKACPFKTTISYACELYGPGQVKTEIIPIWINRIMKNKIIGLKKNYARGWVFITDFCSAIDTILQHGVNKVSYCISSKYHITDLEIINEIIRILHKPEALVYCQTEEILNKSQECSKISDLGWEPIKSINRGLELTIKWYFLDSFGEQMKSVLMHAKK